MTLALQLFKNSSDTRENLRLNFHSLSTEYRRKKPNFHFDLSLKFSQGEVHDFSGEVQKFSGEMQNNLWGGTHLPTTRQFLRVYLLAILFILWTKVTECGIYENPRYLNCYRQLNKVGAIINLLFIFQILGFLNLFVWLGNLWFLFKETPWHNPQRDEFQSEQQNYILLFACTNYGIFNIRFCRPTTWPPADEHLNDLYKHQI